MSGVLLSITVLQVLTILTGLLRAKGLALLLGPAQFGVVSTIDQIVVTLVTLGGFAVPFTAVKFMAQGHSRSEALFQRTGAGFLRLLVSLSAVTTLVASVVVAVSPALFGRDLAAYHQPLQVAVLGVPSAMLLILFVNMLAAAQRPAAAASVNFVAVSALSVGAVAGAWWRGLDGLYVVSVIVALATTSASLVYLGRGLGIRLLTRHTGIFSSLRDRPEILGNAACFYAMMCGGSVSLLVVRTVVLSRLGAVAAGELQAAFSIALTVGAILLPLSNLYLAPLVSRAVPVVGRCRSTHEFAARMLVLLLLGVLPVVLLPGFFVRMLFSQAFVSAAVILWLFVLWQCVSQFVYIYQLLLVGLDDVLFAAALSVTGFGVAIGLTVPFVGWMGLGGVAVALTGGMMFTGIGMLTRLDVRHGSRIPQRVAVRFFGVIGAVLSAGRYFAGRPEDGIALLPRLGFGFTVLLLLWFVLDREERDPRLWLAAIRQGRNDAPVL
jgi:O-antigen/teichoic acid export membrane protein